MTLKPWGEKVIVQVDQEPEKKGHLYIPEEAREKANLATVVAGHGFNRGDRVIVGKYSGVNITLHDDEEYRILKSEEILAVVEAETVLQ